MACSSCNGGIVQIPYTTTCPGGCIRTVGCGIVCENGCSARRCNWWNNCNWWNRCGCCNRCGCGCSCAPGLVAALQLLCRPRFAPLTDYKQFAFITRDFVLGSSLNCPAAATTPYDNLTGPLDGEFVKITPDSCENLEVSGQIYYPNPICTGGTETACCAEGPYFDADSVRLCGLSAVAFGVTETPDFPSAEAAYNELAKLFYQATHAGCGPMPSTPVKPTPCDRSTGDIAGRGTVSLTAGPLVLGNVSVLGEVGDVLILANSEDRLFYFVCRSTIGFIG